jgi:hypothetical protein
MTGGDHRVVTRQNLLLRRKRFRVWRFDPRGENPGNASDRLRNLSHVSREGQQMAGYFVVDFDTTCQVTSNFKSSQT